MSLRAHIKRLGVEAHACNFREQETDEPRGSLDNQLQVSGRLSQAKWWIALEKYLVLSFGLHMYTYLQYMSTYTKKYGNIKKHVHTYKTL